MGKKMKLLITLLCFFTWGESFAETIYVDDTLRIGVRPEIGNTTKPLEIVKSGAKLEVLSREKGYILIKTPKGVEGWVSGSYTTSNPPAKTQLAELKATHKLLEEAYQNLQTELEASKASLKQLEIVSKNTNNHQQNTLASTDPSSAYAWKVWTVALIMSAIIGFLLGIRWHRNKIAQKLGGMQI